MKKHTSGRSAVRRGAWRGGLVWIAALGLLGAAPQSQAIVRLERMALEARVQALREAMPAPAEGDADPHAQIRPWANWNNWNNWNNWPNWGNWANWLNR